MTFIEKYNECKTWQEKVIVMEIFHLIMCAQDKTWTVRKTANEFGVSIGLVSENLKLADYIHIDTSLMKIESRQLALRKVR